MPFEPLNHVPHTKGRSRNPLELSFTRQTVFLNTAVLELLGRPERVQVLYDPDDRRLALVAALDDHDDDSSFAVLYPANKSGASVRTMNFTRLAVADRVKRVAHPFDHDDGRTGVYVYLSEPMGPA